MLHIFTAFSVRPRDYETILIIINYFNETMSCLHILLNTQCGLHSLGFHKFAEFHMTHTIFDFSAVPLSFFDNFCSERVEGIVPRDKNTFKIKILLNL
jgi:hypothetical protein